MFYMVHPTEKTGSFPSGWGYPKSESSPAVSWAQNGEENPFGENPFVSQQEALPGDSTGGFRKVMGPPNHPKKPIISFWRF
jgi:hypothetical protein